MEIVEEMKQVVAEQLGVKIEEIKPETSFTDDLGADSLDAVELIMALEEKFDIQIPDEDAEKMETVNDAIKYIENKMNNPQGNEENDGGN